MVTLKIEQDKISYLVDDVEKAFCHFVESDTTLTIDKTFVDSSLRGQGIGAKLIEEMKSYAIKKNKKLLATCSYAVKYLEKQSL